MSAMEEKDGTQNANNLVSAASVFAINSRSAFVDHYPDLKNIGGQDWEFLLTIAGTGTALLSMAQTFSAERQRELTETVVLSLQAWNQSSFVELRDFLNSVTAGSKTQTEVPNAIGIWVLRSVREVTPDPMAAKVIGLMLMKTFASWWE